jgi:hypothetical protein
VNRTVIPEALAPGAFRLAERRTVDRIAVIAWSDGSLTDRAGYEVSRIRLDRTTVFVLLGDVCLYRWAELPELVRAAARASRSRAGSDAPGLRVAMRRAAQASAVTQ